MVAAGLQTFKDTCQRLKVSPVIAGVPPTAFLQSSDEQDCLLPEAVALKVYGPPPFTEIASLFRQPEESSRLEDLLSHCYPVWLP